VDSELTEGAMSTDLSEIGSEPSRRVPTGRTRWGWIGGVTFAACVVIGIVGTAIRLPYYSIAPGSGIDLNPRVSVSGVRSYAPGGEMLLLTVRQNAQVNVWRWLRASFDPDIDLFREREFVGTQSPAEVSDDSSAAMAGAQFAAKTLALQSLGYELEVSGPGVRVLYVFSTLPASKVLLPDDRIVRIDAALVGNTVDVSRAVRRHEPGDVVSMVVVRDGRRQQVEVKTAGREVEVATGDGGVKIRTVTVIGVQVVPPYEFPVDIEIDTSDIGGPSAGLAMTLSVIDTLSKGELTGDQSVAVTGTIGSDGEVGVVGGIEQKAVAARAAGADLFLVPEAEVAEARKRAGDLPVVGVRTLQDALAALEQAGGDPLPGELGGAGNIA